MSQCEHQDERASGLTIGQVARRAGVGVETVRYYSRRGLVAEPPRPASGYRRYPPSVVGRIRFIKRAQALGFTLQEIGELLTLGDRQCRPVRDRAAAKMRQIEDQIRDLGRLHASLEALVAACDTGRTDAPCAIVEALSQEPVDGA